MGYHPRIESKDKASFLTTRTLQSRLWFINNPELEDAILGYAAKFADRYSAKLYAFAIEGNHLHGPALFPKCNRADFMRDLNSCAARAVPRYTKEHGGGRLWARRYSSEFMPGPADIENYFFYTVLQPVQDGLVEKISEYPGYNCFHDAIHGIKRRFKVINWAEYNQAKRRGKNVSIKDYTEYVYLKYERLPGYENLTQHEYAKLMQKKLEERRVEIVAKRKREGKGFLGREALLAMTRGSLPRKTKQSDARTHRPRVLSICPKRRAECKAWYFQIYFEYRDASLKYRQGDRDATFPEGTYRPFMSAKIDFL
jgi:putative transposase